MSPDFYLKGLSTGDMRSKDLQQKAKFMIREMYQAETKADALAAHRRFMEVFADKYPRANGHALIVKLYDPGIRFEDGIEIAA